MNVSTPSAHEGGGRARDRPVFAQPPGFLKTTRDAFHAAAKVGLGEAEAALADWRCALELDPGGHRRSLRRGATARARREVGGERWGVAGDR